MAGELSRRDFLERTAYAAGLAGAVGLPASALLEEAAAAAARSTPLPRPRNLEIDHFVVLMMENRSFDHYFGWLSGAADAVQDQTYGFESIHSLIAYRFGLGSLTTRMSRARNIGQSFDWERPDFVPPALPDPPEIVTTPCALGGGDVLDSQQAHASDLAELEELALRHGVPVYEGKLGDIFSLPDTVRRGVLSTRL